MKSKAWSMLVIPVLGVGVGRGQWQILGLTASLPS